MAGVPLSIFGSWKGHCLDPRRPHGRNKARVFASAGIRQADAGELRIVLLAAASNAEARLGIANPYGQRYVVDFDLVRQGRTVKIRSTGSCASERTCRD
jgi:hypothetical protein